MSLPQVLLAPGAPSAIGRVRGVALAWAPGGAPRGKRHRFSALVFQGERVDERIDGTAGDAASLQRLRQVTQALPVVAAGEREARGILGPTHPGPVWDVLQLAAAVRPDLPGGSPERLGAAVGIGIEERTPEGVLTLVHQVFLRLVETIAGTDAGSLAHVLRLVAPLDWPLGSLFAEIERHRVRAALEGAPQDADGADFASWIARATPVQAPPRQHGGAGARTRGIELAEALGPFQAGGPLALAMPGYEARAEQVQMVTSVVECLNQGGPLLVEAGTGTGKSLAYLVPAALAAARNRWRVVVSTATINLQDQLHQKDLPILRAALGAARAPRAAVLKGRNNYLCIRRWLALLQTPELEAEERALLVKTLFWLPGTATGDRAELQLTPGEEMAWSRLAAIPEACTPARCAFHRSGVCFLARARRTAETSQVVIANHALVLSDLVSASRVLPDYDVLVVDEAHQLEDEATAQLGWRLGERELLNRLERLAGSGSGGRGSTGALHEGLGLLRRAGADHAARAAELAGDVARAERICREIGVAIRGTYAALAEILRGDAPASDDSATTLRITGAVRAGSHWTDVEAAWDAGARKLPEVLRVARDVNGRLEEIPPGARRDDLRELLSELAGHTDFWGETTARLSEALHTPDRGTVYWLSGARRSTPYVNAAPLDVSETLSSQLFAPREATVLVSATLTVDGSFAYVKERLGLRDAADADVGSPFDFKRSALLYVPYDIPEPNQPGYQEALETATFEAIVAARGRTLALFTSRAQLQQTYDALRERLAAADIALLGQGIDESSRTRLLDRFRHGDRVALFGTSSFWEGIDVVGEALSCVVLARLPFSVPSDPIYAARAEQFEDPFSSYAVPQAVLRFKQGFGRLIRSKTDRGAVVLLDRRIATRKYGSVFLRSLPGCTAKQGPLSRTAPLIRDWLEGPAKS
ncbi:MAG: DEAD/DEAH box helicase [Chloroflexi bacterium]|nr:DEAD/DEAH box helicase [Chloroflexota bacterium]